MHTTIESLCSEGKFGQAFSHKVWASCINIILRTYLLSPLIEELLFNHRSSNICTKEWFIFMDMDHLDSSMNDNFIQHYHNLCNHLSTSERPCGNDSHDGEKANTLLWFKAHAIVSRLLPVCAELLFLIIRQFEHHYAITELTYSYNVSRVRKVGIER